MKSLLSFILIVSVLFSFELNAQNKKKNKKAKDEKPKILIVKIGKPEKMPDGTIFQETIKIDLSQDLTHNQINIIVKKAKEIMKEEGKGNRATSSELATLAYDLNYYSYHPQIEKVTKVYKSWYKNLSKGLKIMAQTKNDYNIGKFMNSAKKNQELIQKYTKISKRINEMLEKPQEIPKEVLKKMELANKKKGSGR